MQSIRVPRRLPDSWNRRAAIVAWSCVKSRRCTTTRSASSRSALPSGPHRNSAQPPNSRPRSRPLRSTSAASRSPATPESVRERESSYPDGSSRFRDQPLSRCTPLCSCLPVPQREIDLPRVQRRLKLVERGQRVPAGSGLSAGVAPDRPAKRFRFRHPPATGQLFERVYGLDIERISQLDGGGCHTGSMTLRVAPNQASSLIDQGEGHWSRNGVGTIAVEASHRCHRPVEERVASGYERRRRRAGRRPKSE